MNRPYCRGIGNIRMFTLYAVDLKSHTKPGITNRPYCVEYAFEFLEEKKILPWYLLAQNLIQDNSFISKELL